MRYLIGGFDKDIIGAAKRHQATVPRHKSAETTSSDSNIFISGTAPDDDIDVFRPSRVTSSSLPATAEPHTDGALAFVPARTIYEIKPTSDVTEKDAEEAQNLSPAHCSGWSEPTAGFIESGWSDCPLSLEGGDGMLRAVAGTADISDLELDDDEITTSMEVPDVDLKHKRAFTNLKQPKRTISISSFGSSAELGRRAPASETAWGCEFDDLRISPLHVGPKEASNPPRQRRFWLCPELHKDDDPFVTESKAPTPEPTSEEPKRLSDCHCTLGLGLTGKDGHICFCTDEEKVPMYASPPKSPPVKQGRHFSSDSTASIQDLVLMIDKSLSGMTAVSNESTEDWVSCDSAAASVHSSELNEEPATGAAEDPVDELPALRASATLAVIEEYTEEYDDVIEEDDDHGEWMADADFSSPRRGMYARPDTPVPPSPTQSDDEASPHRELYIRPDTPTPPSPTESDDDYFSPSRREPYLRPGTPTPPAAMSPTRTSRSSPAGSTSSGGEDMDSTLEMMVRWYINEFADDEEGGKSGDPETMDGEQPGGDGAEEQDIEDAERWSNFSDDGPSGLIVAKAMTPMNTPGFEYYEEVYGDCLGKEPSPKKVAGARVRFNETVVCTEYMYISELEDAGSEASVEELLSQYGAE